MRVIVCGAGQVGGSIATYLSREGNDVTLIDQSRELVAKLGESLDIRAIQGHASHPDVLERAGAPEADVIIAVTQADEVNMIACQVCHSLFNVPTKIARVRHQSYLDPGRKQMFSRKHLPIDVVISPELEVARSIIWRLKVPGTFDMIPLGQDKVRLVGVVCEEDCPIINTPLGQIQTLFPDLHLEVVMLIRGERAMIPTEADQILAGDLAYFVVETQHLRRALAAFGHEERSARRVMVLGGGNVGLYVAREIEQTFAGVSLIVVEKGLARAEHIAQQLGSALVLHGDVLDTEILTEAEAETVETVVAVTNDDETNVLASLLAKRAGVDRAITLVNKTTYSALSSGLGIDALVNPRATTVSTILQHVRRGRIKAVHSLREGFAEAIEAEVLETAPLANVSIRDSRLPHGIKVAALIRQGQVLMTSPDLVIRPKDRVIMIAELNQIRRIEELVSVGLEYF